MYKSQIDQRDMFGAIYRSADQIQDEIGISEPIKFAKELFCVRKYSGRRYR